jgi:apolipoprotein N-acyltransferase
MLEKDLRIRSDFRHFLYFVLFYPACIYPPPFTSHDALQLRWMMLPFSPYPSSFLICHAIGFQLLPPLTLHFQTRNQKSRGRKNCFVFFFTFFYFCAPWLTSFLGKFLSKLPCFKFVLITKHLVIKTYWGVEIELQACLISALSWR